MSRRHRINRSAYSARRTYKARPHPLFVLFMIIGFVALVLFGFLIYEPVSNAIMNWGESGTGILPSLPFPGSGEGETPPEAQQPEEGGLSAAAVGGGGLRGVWAPSGLVQNPQAFEQFVASLPGAGLNAVMVDIKDGGGNILFESGDSDAIAFGAVVEDAFDLAALTARLADDGIYLIARMGAFSDEVAARGDTNLAVAFQQPGMLWLDNYAAAGGRPWLNPNSPDARDYLTRLAVEATRLGASLVVVDDLRFPPNSLANAHFGDMAGGRVGVLSGFVDEITAAVEQAGGRLAVYMPAIFLADDTPNQTFFGGWPGDILGNTTVLGALPQQFPAGGFSSENLTLEAPAQDTMGTLSQIAEFGLEHLEGELILLIGGGADYITPQAELLLSLGIEEFILFGG